MKLSDVWDFVAGESRRTPLCVALAVIAAVAVTRLVPGIGTWSGVVFMAILAFGLVLGVFERS
jgi:hypothetical protein